MSSGVHRHGDREIARGLVESLRPALAGDAPPIAMLAARDVAQLLGLTGLEAALAVCTDHAGAVRPREIEHLAERLARIADAAAAEGSLAPFMAAEPELQSLAAHLEQVEWDAPSQSAAEATYSVLEQLAGLSVEATGELESARMTAPVAAGLRAALDWLGVDDRAQTAVLVQDSALEISVRVGFAAGLAPAGAVLATVEGSLGAADGERWVMRLPLAAARPSFLLLRQGHLGLALPWHSVARLRMLHDGQRAQLVEPSLPPLAPSSDANTERPAALLACGLRRAWFVADRIVWRIVAEPEDADMASPVAGLTQLVRVDGEHRYWIVDPAALLRSVAPVEVPPPAPRPRAALLLAAESVEPLAPVVSEPHASAMPAPTITTVPDMPATMPAAESADPFAVLDELLPALVPDAPAEPTAAPVAVPQATFTPVVEVLRPDQVLAPHELAAARPAPDVAIAPVEPREPAPAPAPAPGSVPPPKPAAKLAPVARAPREPMRLSAADVQPLEPTLSRPRRALVVDDSLVARIFLTRMLEQRGFPVVTGENAAELWAELEARPFGVVFVDVCLPDTRGRVHLERVLDLRAQSREPFSVVVLTRDHDDEVLAEGAGARLMLRKPFESAALDQLLMKLPRLPEDFR